MHLDIEDILKENGRCKSISYEFLPNEINFVADDCKFEEPIILEAELTNINRIIRIKGRIGTEYSTFCARCLCPIKRKIAVAIDEDIDEAAASNEEESYTYTGKSISLDGIINDAILLRLPIRHLCRDDCKAICATCGMDLNNGDCSCEKTVGNEYFDVLKDLKLDV